MPRSQLVEALLRLTSGPVLGEGTSSQLLPPCMPSSRKHEPVGALCCLC